MKQYINKSFLVAGFALLGLSSCKKELEQVNPFGLTPTPASFTSLSSFQSQLSGMYNAFASADYYNGYLGVTTDMFTDNVYETTESLVNFNQVHNWLYDASDRQRTYFTSMWRQPYNTILQANTIINNIDAFKGENELQYNRILGQALAGRAIAHFDLLRGYADANDRNGTGPGIPVITEVSLGTPARATIKEVFDAIYADLNQAITLLSNVDIAPNSATNKGLLDVWGARAALARVALQAKDFPTAITQATAVINQFPLATRAQFPGIWNDANAAEQIWNIVNNSGDPGSPFPSAEVMSFRFNRNTFAILPAFIQFYDTTGFSADGVGRDIRFSNYFFVRNTSAGGTINNWGLSKFRGKGTAADNLVNYKVFRVAEMYLIRAEANATANAAAANSDLNALKRARISGYTDQNLSGTALTDEIMAERRRELCFENQRWFDLKRTTKTVNRPLTGTGNPNGGVQTNLPSSSHRWTWPIPEVEMRANPNMVQNPGYL
jgi:starch-binding outer membrane protein, SusD/RagB family